ncbi:hypothetical protein SDC9_07329 [bioreactor metagenome]|uniref:Uncharacterized protein n=1 Tax=bioreactor metagenome TaxID=1076179 RepID=A0A644T6G1_9ZZZZ|nr:hypothetical protein [Dehalococcoides mccartyi]
MTNEKKQAIKAALKKVGKVIWSAIPWVLIWIGVTCWFSLMFILADKTEEQESQITALQSENKQLDEEVDWLRSLVKQYYQREVPDEQIQQ